MSEQEKQTASYRSIFKATTLFGGVQAYQILIGIITSKFVAVLLGPLGVGIKGLFQSSIQVISGFTSLGLSRSAVRDVSVANGTEDRYKIGKTVAALRKLVWITGLFGMILTIVLSPFLSKVTFGNYDYTLPFIFLSIILLFNQLSAGQMVVLQGLRKLKYLAKASAIGVTLGLIVSIPLYYMLGIKGIVPTLLLNALTSLLLSYYFSKKIAIEKVEVSSKEAFKEGKIMMRMGVAMSVSSVLTLLFSYLLRSFIRYNGSVEEVGIFTAGFAIVNTYVGMIFDAMVKDFYPRLSAVSNDNEKCSLLVNQQAEVGTYIMAPMLLACLTFMPIVIWGLYSSKFMGAMDYIYWAVPGMFFKLLSWAIALIFVSKGASKQYMFNEIFGSTLIFICSVLGYYLCEMKGLGLGFTAGYFLYLVKVWWTARRSFGFSFSTSFIKLYITQFVFVALGLLCVIFLDGGMKYAIGIMLLCVSAFISIKGINEQTKIVQLIRERIRNGKE